MKSHYVLALEKVKPPLIDFVGHRRPPGLSRGRV